MKYRCKLFALHIKIFSIFSLLMVAMLPVRAQSEKVDFKLTILNSIGEPQKNLYLQVKGYSSRHEIDENGVISFEAYLSEDYVRIAELFFKEDEEAPVKRLELKKENPEQTLYVNSTGDILRFKQENKQVEVEGILVDEAGEPIEGATISILGTGSQTKSDEIGLFHIITDYNHPIMIRARGMETMTMSVDGFIRNEDVAMNVVMKNRNSDYIYNVAEEMPVYRGGMKYFSQYLSHAAAYPEEKIESGIEGVVVVQFVVEKDGSISQPQIMRHLDPDLDTIAYRAIELSPRWIPAKDAGHTVRCRYSMPVAFKIPIPEPIVPADTVASVNDSLRADSLMADSLVNDSLITDSLKVDSVRMKMLADSIQLHKDSLTRDSLRMDSINKSVVKVEKKAKKRPCAFVRFFRRLFGIKRGDDVVTEDVVTLSKDVKDKVEPKKKKRRRRRKHDAEMQVVQDTAVVKEMLAVPDMPVENSETEENNTKNINL